MKMSITKKRNSNTGLQKSKVPPNIRERTKSRVAQPPQGVKRMNTTLRKLTQDKAETEAQRRVTAVQEVPVVRAKASRAHTSIEREVHPRKTKPPRVDRKYPRMKNRRSQLTLLWVLRSLALLNRKTKRNLRRA